MADYFELEPYMLMLLAAAILALLAAVVPVVFLKKHFSPPIMYLIIGIVCYFSFIHLHFEPLDNLELIEKVTEFVVIIALTNTGLKINEPFKWKTWRYAFRLLAITMPLTIVAAVFLGWWIMGLAPATAMLYGAIMSPTDPVLASELQTSEPGEEDSSKSKLGLTAEAGINDGLAFPFTYFAIFAAKEGLDYKEWIGGWLLHDVLLKIVIGVGVGLLCGWVLYKLIFTISKDNETINKISRGILSLTLTLLPYALTEIVGGYGFIAVFVSACLFSDYEKHLRRMNSLHDFNEEIESLVVAVIFITTGVFIAANYTILFEVKILAVALLMVFVVRPLTGYIALAKTGLSNFQKFVLSFYGIRGIGSFYYMAYALTTTPFAQPDMLIDITLATVFLSVIVHGLSARTVQQKIKVYDS